MTNPVRLIALAGFMTASLSAGALAAERYSFDSGHTEIRFLWDHVGLSTQSGEFREFDGALMLDREDVSKSSVEIEIKAASLDTGVPPLDEHMNSADMFDTAAHPTITFKSTKVMQTGAKRARILGDLTIKGVTKPVTLDVGLNFEGDHPLAPYIPAYGGAKYTAFSARGSLLRSEFGVGFGAPLTSDEIQIVIETEMRGAE